MKKLINLFFLLLILTTTSLISCTVDSDRSKGGRHISASSEDNLEVIDNNLQDVYNEIKAVVEECLATDEDANAESILAKLEKYHRLIDSEIIDGVLYLSIDSIYEYVCDPIGATGIGIVEDGDETEINAMYEGIINDLYPDSLTKSTRSIFDRVLDFIGKKQVLVWDPWEDGISVNVQNAHVTPSHDWKDINNFGKYDIVLMVCHGYHNIDNTEGLIHGGVISLPQDLRGLTDYLNKQNFDFNKGRGSYRKRGRDGNVVRRPTYRLRYADLMKLLPDDLSNTFIWTCMCHAGAPKSDLRRAVFEKGAKMFAGANNTVTFNNMKGLFKKFVTKYYECASAERAALDAFGLNNETSFSGSLQYTYEYTIQDDHGYGNYGLWKNYNGQIVSNLDLHPIRSDEGDAFYASITMPFELYNKYHSSSATRGHIISRALSNNSAGFWIKNKKTGEIKEIDINKKTVEPYKKPYFHPNDDNLPKEIARVEMVGITDGLAPGTYEYRTYLEIDGEKEYSDEIYEFTLQEHKLLSCPDFNHPHAIDLGLPSGRKWSCCDVGANSVLDYGDLFAWGEIKTRKFGGLYEDVKDRKNYEYLTYSSYGSLFGEYDTYIDIGNEISGSRYDVAHVNWGNNWRMPTKADVEELMESCVFISGNVTKYSPEGDLLDEEYHSGNVAIGPNGNAIFFVNSDFWTGTLADETIGIVRSNGVSGNAYVMIGFSYDLLDYTTDYLLMYDKDGNKYIIEGRDSEPNISTDARYHGNYIHPIYGK